MKIDFLEFGSSGQPIVFLHGWKQDKRSFSSLVPFLHHHYHLFLIDLPGFGKSDPPSLDFTSFDYNRAITDWINRKGLKKIILVGHSFGGKIAAIIASHHPELVSKLVLIASSGIPHSPGWLRFKSCLPLWFHQIVSPFLKIILASRDYKQAGKLLPIFKTVVREDLRPVFSKIKTPTLIIWGEQDRELPLEDGQKIHQLINNSHLAVVDGDHFPFWQKPKKIVQLIDNFAKAKNGKI